MPDAVRWLDVDDEIVVFNPISWMFANLDATAAELWRVLGAADWAEIEMIDYLRGRYKMAEPEATSIVRKFVADLEHNHALGKSFGACRTHVVGRHCLQHGRAGMPHQYGGKRIAKHKCRHDRRLQ